MRRLATLLAATTALAAVTPAVAQDQAADQTSDQSGEMDHAAMDHGDMDMTGMDHSNMDHSNMHHGEMDMSGMDHSTMDHSMMGMTMDAGDGAMDHSGHMMMTMPQVDDQPGDAPPPVPTDHAADAIFGSAVMDRSRQDLLAGMRFQGSVIGLDELEYRADRGGDSYSFAGSAWTGGDIDRAVLAYEGEGNFHEAPETVELAAYWRHAVNPWFNVQLGARHDFRPDPERTYALVGIEGLAPYWIEVSAQAFVSDKGDVHFRGSAEHDMRLTQRLVFEPAVEFDVAMQDVPELGIGSGLESFELSARLRYEIERNFAPYVGFAWERKVGDSADYTRAEGEDPSRFTWLTGLRFWF